MNLTANEKKVATARQKRYVLLLAVMLVLLFIIIVLSFWVGYYTSAGTKCIFIKIWF